MIRKALLAVLFFAGAAAHAENFYADMVDLKSGKSAGRVNITQSQYGMVFTPDITGIPVKEAGAHGFHVHEKGSCGSSVNKEGKTMLGGAAGGHYDPAKTGKHGAPWNNGSHLGDLPRLFVTKEGVANSPVLAPRLRPSDLHGRALMIHVGGDTYGDQPPLGGGGARMICGVIKSAQHP